MNSREPIRGVLASMVDAVRTSLWPVPTMGIVLALVGAILLMHLDRSVDDLLPSGLSSWVFGDDSDAARSMLGSLASSLITVTSLTFSLTVVTLQLASSQFSPRLLRTFTRDPVVQRTLALFLGTFVFTLTVLRAVRSSSDSTEEFVPQISVTVTYLLTVASVFGLILFLAHLAQEIRVETMLRTVHREAMDTVRRVLSDVETTEHNDFQPAVGSIALLSPRSGFITHVRTEELCAVASELDTMIMVTAPTGSSVVEGTPAGQAWPTQRGRQLTDQERSQVQRGFDRAVEIGFERTSIDDVSYGLRQLTDIAAKALSPGVNDPTTATHSLGHSSALVCALARLPLGDQLVRDDTGTLRVVVRRPTFGDLLNLAVDQPRRYGAGEPQVVERLYQLLSEVGWVVAAQGHRLAVRDELRRLRDATLATPTDETQRLRYDRLHEQVERHLSQ
ncbi:DUF2254 domain-containing protein [Microlunatus panaciterrae]|uniref:Membrane protein n=1 Tax=Microlunatus panaciterrae TaxID=400768 RepID=A0ABS2RGW4_9ACTN|nr:DUF2254 domain-containing protein [Microlunatus panaciterrae]MBM7798249.1 putative membrane protein [Microlunatus panaciterrae]